MNCTMTLLWVGVAPSDEGIRWLSFHAQVLMGLLCYGGGFSPVLKGRRCRIRPTTWRMDLHTLMGFGTLSLHRRTALCAAAGAWSQWGELPAPSRCGCEEGRPQIPRDWADHQQQRSEVTPGCAGEVRGARERWHQLGSQKFPVELNQSQSKIQGRERALQAVSSSFFLPTRLNMI